MELTNNFIKIDFINLKEDSKVKGISTHIVTFKGGINFQLERLFIPGKINLREQFIAHLI